YYPIGEGIWKARFAPMETGTYLATARLKDRNGTVQSESVRFHCTASSRKGFLRIGRKDPRFLEYTEGAAFFAIGQNLAFVGEGQYVNLTKAEQIFDKLSRNGANFLRIWTCCKDWAMAIEARKSAWDRSWHRRKIIVPIPGSENEPRPRKCVKLEGGDGTSVTVSPCHPVALRPEKRYVLTGQFRADGPNGLRVDVGRGNVKQAFDAARKGQWRKFRQEFVTGKNDFWLGRLVLSLAGTGTVWLDNMSLKEAGGGAELLWEADVNRPIRGLYNQLDCFMLDELIEAAEQNGIHLMLCLVTRDLYMKSLSNDQSREYQQAIQDAKKLMRYAVARWGYSTGVAAWEYFNEIDPGLPTDRFYTEVGQYLEQVDIYHHLRTTSTWHPSAKDCHHRRLDVGQLHHYMRTETKENIKDEVAVVIDKTRFLREHAPTKPVLIGEFGLATPKWGLSEHMRQDDEAVHFHNSLWASAFAGASGTAMFWWWDQLDRQDAYGHYRPLAAFLANVSFAGLQETRATASNEHLCLLGYQGSDRAYVWLFNSKATWWNLVIEKQQPTEIKGTTIEIQGLQPGDYRVEWWHTYEGKIIEEERVSLTEGLLHVSVPPFSRDIACKIER
ncbi:MAG: apiosidase-like domain-containing protein, partial [Planctomycetota bacterium]